MARAAALGLPVAVHAESPRSCAGQSAATGAPGPPHVRPVRSWSRSSARSSWPRTPGARCTWSTSTGAGVAAVAEARPRRGRHLRDLPPLPDADRGGHGTAGTAAKCAPLLRRPPRGTPWAQLVAGRIAFCGIDHRRARPHEGGDLLADRLAGSPASRPCSRCCWTRGAPRVPIALGRARDRRPRTQAAVAEGAGCSRGSMPTWRWSTFVRGEVGRRHDRTTCNPFAGRRLRGRVGATAAAGAPCSPTAASLRRRAAADQARQRRAMSDEDLLLARSSSAPGGSAKRA